MSSWVLLLCVLALAGYNSNSNSHFARAKAHKPDATMASGQCFGPPEAPPTWLQWLSPFGRPKVDAAPEASTWRGWAFGTSSASKSEPSSLSQRLLGLLLIWPSVLWEDGPLDDGLTACCVAPRSKSVASFPLSPTETISSTSTWSDASNWSFESLLTPPSPPARRRRPTPESADGATGPRSHEPPASAVRDEETPTQTPTAKPPTSSSRNDAYASADVDSEVEQPAISRLISMWNRLSGALSSTATTSDGSSTPHTPSSASNYSGSPARHWREMLPGGVWLPADFVPMPLSVRTSHEHVHSVITGVIEKAEHELEEARSPGHTREVSTPSGTASDTTPTAAVDKRYGEDDQHSAILHYTPDDVSPIRSDGRRVGADWLLQAEFEIDSSEKMKRVRVHSPSGSPDRPTVPPALRLLTTSTTSASASADADGAGAWDGGAGRGVGDEDDEEMCPPADEDARVVAYHPVISSPVGEPIPAIEIAAAVAKSKPKRSRRSPHRHADVDPYTGPTETPTAPRRRRNREATRAPTPSSAVPSPPVPAASPPPLGQGDLAAATAMAHHPRISRLPSPLARPSATSKASGLSSSVPSSPSPTPRSALGLTRALSFDRTRRKLTFHREAFLWRTRSLNADGHVDNVGALTSHDIALGGRRTARAGNTQALRRAASMRV